MNEKKVFEKQIETYIPPKVKSSIKLDANENPYNILENLMDQFICELKKLPVNRYPCTDSDELRLLLAESLDLKISNIVCGNGSDEIIQLVINAFLDPDDKVVVHIPTFTMYSVFTKIAGGIPIEIEPEKDFRVDPQKIIDSSNKEKAKLIFLCNPNNPTGFAFSREDVIKILESTDAYVVVDEAYYEFLDETVIDLINSYEKLIVLRTMSKAMALAGARIGFGFACEKTMAALYKVKPPYNLNTFSQLIGKIYLNNKKMIGENINNIKKQREYLSGELEKIKELKTYKSKGNYILIKTRKVNEILKYSQKAGIAIRSYGNTPYLEDCLRISIGTEDENKKILNVLKKVVG